MRSKEETQKVISASFANKPVLRAYLFGSYARGEATDESDVDVLVELDYANGGGDFGNYLQMMDDLTDRFGRKVDLVSANGLSKFIAPYIHKDKLLLYER